VKGALNLASFEAAFCSLRTSAKQGSNYESLPVSRAKFGQILAKVTTPFGTSPLAPRPSRGSIYISLKHRLFVIVLGPVNITDDIARYIPQEALDLSLRVDT
jgi:hypothetical protein